MATEVLGKEMKIDSYVDSKTLFDIVAKESGTTENRILIDIFALRDSYEKGELARITWIPGISNPANGLKIAVVTKLNRPWEWI